MNLFYSFLKIIFFIPLWLIFPAKVLNRENLPRNRRTIVIANHLSWLDIIMIALYVPRFRHFIAKKELGKNPFLRLILRSIGVIFIDRGKSDMNAIKKIIKLLKKNHGVNIFPEGTRNRVDESIQHIKSGVVMFSLKSDTPVVPVMIYKKTRPFRRNYIMAMPEISMDEFKGKPLGSVMSGATARVEESLIAGKAALDNKVTEIKMKKARKGKALKEETVPVETETEKIIDGNKAPDSPEKADEEI